MWITFLGVPDQFQHEAKADRSPPQPEHNHQRPYRQSSKVKILNNSRSEKLTSSIWAFSPECDAKTDPLALVWGQQTAETSRDSEFVNRCADANFADMVILAECA